MNEQMEFPETWEEYEQEYGFNDSDEVYTNNSRLIQSFRVKQYLDHLEQEPCEDAISRNMVLSEVKSGMIRTIDGENWKKVNDNVRDIQALPPVTPQPKTGHWIIKDDKEQGYDIGGVKTWYIQIMCNKCGFIKTAIEGHTGQYHFCPNCGARMIESEG